MDLKISLKKKEQLKKDISKLGYNEHCEIFNIIRKDTDKMSENNNGIFINLKYVKDETIIKVQNFVTYCKNNKHLTQLTQLTNENIKNENNKLENNKLENIKNENIKFENIKNENNKLENNKLENNKLENKLSIKEDLSQGYESYNIDDEFIDEKKKDKFNFKNYMEKISIYSFKKFDEENTKIFKNNTIPNILNKKLKLSGVKERIMKKCRNISKQQTTKINQYKIRKKYILEEILDDNINDNINDIDIISNIPTTNKKTLNYDELTEDF